jgi:glycine betaine/proline transport system substrate-binding protein
MHTAMDEVIAGDVAGMGDWNHESSTTSAMLSQVKDLIKRGKWAAFGCWKPHWMNIEIDMKYLEGVPGTEKFVSQSIVYTVVSSDFHKKFPEVHTFFKQFLVPSAVQSKWIYDYGYKEIDQEKVASDWIRANMDMVGKWFDGVRTADGKPAMDAIRAAFK